MTSTVVRVKRRLEEDPVDALLLCYKRRKTTNGSEDASQALLKFAATVEKADIEVVKRALSHAKSKDELKDSFKLRAPSIQLKQRIESNERIKENRFKILNCARTKPLVDGIEDPPITIFDVGVDDIVEENEEEVKYVYDLYSTDFMPEEVDIDDGFLESLVSVEPFKSQLQYRGSEDSEEIDPYEEDSNDENNWRNDYPDSDHSVNEDDMRLAANLRGMGLDDGHDLSSDSEDERYFEASGGSPLTGYDAYKRRIIREQKRSNFVDVIESEESSDKDFSNESSESEENL